MIRRVMTAWHTSSRRVKPCFEQCLHQVGKVRAIIAHPQPFGGAGDTLLFKQYGLLLPPAVLRFPLGGSGFSGNAIWFAGLGSWIAASAAAYLPGFSAIDDFPPNLLICKPAAASALASPLTSRAVTPQLMPYGRQPAAVFLI